MGTRDGIPADIGGQLVKLPLVGLFRSELAVQTQDPQAAARERLGPTILKETLDRLAQLGLPPSPENFAKAHADIARKRSLPIERQYTSELAALGHALVAFENLLIGNTWLNARFRDVAKVAGDNTTPETDRIARLRKLLDDIAAGKAEAIGEAAQVIAETREALAELVNQVKGLAEFVGSSKTNFGRALSLAEDCIDVSDVRRAIDAIARDTRRLNEQVSAAGADIGSTYGIFASGASQVLGATKAEPTARRAA